MLYALSLLMATLPALIPWTSFFLYRAADQQVFLSRDSWHLQYDYIIVGGGSAGCVLANRLTENSAIKVLLLEAGGSENSITDIPQACFMIQKTPIDWQYQIEPQKRSCFGLVNRTMSWPRGKVLGGSSVLNFMIYMRGNARDYDEWEQNGASGWSYREMLPYFIKAEDNHDASVAYNGYHGRGGPLTVERISWVSKLSYAFLEAVRLFGYPVVDINGPSQMGFQLTHLTARRGGRCSAAKAYLNDIRYRDNLHVVTFAHVTKVLFNSGKQAVGVTFDRFHSTHRVFARKEVIISAGVINTPQLLMLSGIGPAAHLQHHGIPVLADLPVGMNLQDHLLSPGINFEARAPKPSNEFWTHSPDVTAIPNIVSQTVLGKGPLTSTSGLDVNGFVRTSRANAKYTNLPDVQIIFFAGCLSSDGGQRIRNVTGFTDLTWTRLYKPMIGKNCFNIIPVLLKPLSRGYIKLRSTDPYDHPIIEPNYYARHQDLQTMTEAMQMCYQLGSSAPFRDKHFDVVVSDRIVPGCEPFPLFSEEYMRCLVQTLTGTIYHPVGTCKMGSSNDPTTVLDAQLRVKGVKRLRVVDASIMPQIVSGNTYAPVIAIAEKAADIIKKVQRTPNVEFVQYMNVYSNDLIK